VLSSPLGEQNDKTNKAGNLLRSESSEQNRILQPCENMCFLQEQTQGAEVIQKISLRNTVSNDETTCGTPQRLSGMFEKQVETHREEICFKVRNGIPQREGVVSTSQKVREMHGNKEEKYSGSYGQIEQGQSCPRTQGNIFCDSQKDFSKEGCAGSKVGTIAKMAGQQSRRICKVHRESTAFPQEIKNGNAEFSTEIHCLNTYFRKVYPSDVSNQDIKVGVGDIRGHIDILFLISGKSQYLAIKHSSDHDSSPTINL
jgi:hypothetical protein